MILSRFIIPINFKPLFFVKLTKTKDRQPKKANIYASCLIMQASLLDMGPMNNSSVLFTTKQDCDCAIVIYKLILLINEPEYMYASKKRKTKLNICIIFFYFFRTIYALNIPRVQQKVSSVFFLLLKFTKLVLNKK